MTLQQLLLELSKRDIKLAIDGDQLDIDAPENALTDELIEALREHKAVLLDRLKQRFLSAVNPLQKQEYSSIVPLSFGQERLWDLIKSGSDSTVYNIPIAFRIEGPVNQEILEKSLIEIIHRHEILRTCFLESDTSGDSKNEDVENSDLKGPRQKILENEIKSPLLAIDLSQETVDNLESEALKIIVKESESQFSLSDPDLMRVKLIRLAPERYVIGFVFHHIIADYWSLGILFRELSYLYAALLNQEQSLLPELPIQYADYCVWQKQTLKGLALESLLDYWKDQFNVQARTLNLPVNHSETLDHSYRGDQKYFSLSRELTDQLKRLSQQQSVTLYVTLFTALGILFHYYSDQEDIIISSPFAGRSQPELENLIGFFNNVLPLRINIAGNLQFPDLLHQVRDVVASVSKYQDLPLQQLAELPGLSRVSLTRAAFALQTALEYPLVNQVDLAVTRLSVHNGKSNFDLYLQMWEEGEILKGSIEYKSVCFSEEAISKIAADFIAVLSLLPSEANSLVSEIEAKVKFSLEKDVKTKNEKRLYVAPRNETEQKLVRIWENVFGVEKIGVHEGFFDLGGSSILSLKILNQIQGEFGKKLSLSDFGSYRNIEDLAKYLSTGEASSSLVIPMQTKGNNPPLFLATPLFNDPNIFRRLATLLGDDYPFYALRIEVKSDDYQSYQSFEEIASRCISEMRTIQSNGPYFIGGYCAGSFLAHEIVRQLTDQGETVAAFIVIDTVARGPKSPYPFSRIISTLVLAYRRIWLMLLKYSDFSSFTVEASSLDLKQNEIRKARQLFRTKILPDLNRYFKYQRWAVRNYRSKQPYAPYPGKILLFLAEKEPGFRSLFPDAGWSQYAAKGVETVTVPAHHFNIVLDDISVKYVASKIKNYSNQT
ncbi:MAG: hypothetical protein HC921_11190 [Synechococcaceae cyanobacterium SM2_3_1]|nr:hypothetical protein [Synechococcaceae cyanobacterium SM2_3_1]